MPLLVKCPSPLPNCFLSPKCSDRPLSFFQVLVKVCPLRSLSLGPHSLWDPKLDTGDLGCWYVPNVGGIQQLSECPRTRHSCVHISVASTRPRGPRGPSTEEEGKKTKQVKNIFRSAIKTGSLPVCYTITWDRTETETDKSRPQVFVAQCKMDLILNTEFYKRNISLYIVYQAILMSCTCSAHLSNKNNKK